MDDTSIQMIREDLTEDFHALDDVHTKSIRRLLEEFNDDQMLLMLDTECAMNDNSLDEPRASGAWQQESERDTPTSPVSCGFSRTIWKLVK